MDAAASNRRLIHGRPVQKEFAKHLPQIAELSDKVPDWPELVYFTAWIADKAQDHVTAITYYRRFAHKFDATEQKGLTAFIESRLSQLELIESTTRNIDTTRRIAAPSPFRGNASAGICLSVQ